MRFGFKKQKPRRSELRLGKQAANYQSATVQSQLSIMPLIANLQARQTKLMALVILFILSWGIYYLFVTPTFFIYGADIRGYEAVSVHEIYVASDLDTKSIFWVNPSQVAANIMALPNIKSAQVTVQLPATVIIEVSERTPELLWQTGDTVWWVDGEGIVVPPRGDTEGMLRVVDNDQQPVEVGYQVDPTIVRGAQMLRMLTPGLSEIRHSRSLGLTVASPEGWPIYLGDGSEMRRKLVSLTAILEKVRSQDLTLSYIDLRDPLRPVYKEKELIPIGEPTRPFVNPAFTPQPYFRPR